MNDLDTWSPRLAARGLVVLPQSHLVPVDVWLRRTADGTLLHLTGRGTTLRLRTYADSDLTVMLLRSECDCQSHREAGATHRVVLRPGAAPATEVAYDGAALHGWTGVEAARLGVAALAPVLDRLLATTAAPVHAPGSTRLPSPATSPATATSPALVGGAG